MRIQSLLLLFALFSTAFGQRFIARVIPDYNQLTAPHVKVVNVERTDSAIKFTFHSAQFIITQSGDLVQPLITTIRKGQPVDHQLINAAPFFPDAECTAVSFDADKNGVDDLFLVFPYSLTDVNPNVDVVAAYFFSPDSSFTFVRLRSYYGDIDLFRDFNRDGKFEYACINQVRSNSLEYDIVNVFAMKNGAFSNITSTIPGYPIFVVRTGSGLRRIMQLPAPLANHWYLKEPDVLAGNNSTMN